MRFHVQRTYCQCEIAKCWLQVLRRTHIVLCYLEANAVLYNVKLLDDWCILERNRRERNNLYLYYLALFQADVYYVFVWAFEWYAKQIM